MSREEAYRRLEAKARELGADLFGVADLRGKSLKVLELPEDICNRLPYGISMGIALCSGVIEEIVDHPTLFYLHHYRQANYILDQMAFRISKMIEEMGGKALPIAASQIVDWERQQAHFDHKTLAELAGLGWRGRNNLLVTPKYGARVRLVSILTDLPLRVDGPYRGPRCGDCTSCIEACPVGAIKEDPKDFDHIRCFEKLKEFRRKYNVGQYICGICIKACGPKL
ncbi:MAG: hypothetical protein DRG31_04025 [Deltaproteobacteria bacterium]|nr:MAG: hypothetical protein DRG31_04025 [Deltaproteobacteria bacterium]